MQKEWIFSLPLLSTAIPQFNEMANRWYAESDIQVNDMWDGWRIYIAVENKTFRGVLNGHF